jgi:Xaa-Pro aminopeptidase
VPDLTSRRSRLTERLRDRDLDAALVTHPVNVRYLTGLDSSNAAVLVPASGDAVLATDDRYAEAARHLCPDLEVVTARAVGVTLVQRAAEAGLRTLGVERHVVTLTLGDALASAADDAVRLVDLEQAVEALRAVKEPDEVALVAEACELAAAALDGLLSGPVAGRSEFDLARDLEARMLRLGAEGLAFTSIVAAGPNGAVPHHRPGSRVVDRGDLLTLDFGARVDGYHSDCTRTVVVGREPTDWQREVYDVVAAAQRAGLEALAPEARLVDVDHAARRVVEDAGFGPFFTHGLGHGVGLEIHEPPWLAASAPPASTLAARSIVTVEPGIYLPDRGGVRIEDTVDVGGDAVVVLTPTTKACVVVD